MFAATYFVQGCPICGRNLQVRLEYLGRLIACPHCQGQFTASDPATHPIAESDSSEQLMLRANQLLATTTSRRWRTR